MNKEKYLAKIKKLLNLAKRSSNPSESSNAMSQAQNLMRKYNVSLTDVDLMEINEARSKGAPSDAQKVPVYMAHLAAVIGFAFGVKFYVTYRYTERVGIPKRVVVFYGPNERPQIAAYAFDVLSRQLVRARSEYIGAMRKGIKAATKTARADTFCESWVSGAYQVIDNFVITEPEQTLMEAYQTRMKENGGLSDGVTRSAKACRGQSEAEYAGYLAGRNARLNQAVSGDSVQPLMIEGGTV